MPQHIDISISDDSGLLSLVDCSKYETFVGEDWEYDQLLNHFITQGKKRAILAWNCGDGGGDYLVRIVFGKSGAQGHRQIQGVIKSSSGALNLVSYDALTMAAQFEDEKIPSKHEAQGRIEVQNGAYLVRIVQMYDPTSVELPENGQPYFVIDLEPGEGEPWSQVAWITT